MRIATTEIGTRGILITITTENFSFPTSVYAINCTDFILLCDTHLGADTGEKIRSILHERFGKKSIVVFNTHADYDHVWGNAVFQESTIIAHETTRRVMAEKNEMFRELLSDFACGDNPTVLPNTTFTSKYSFEEEGITLLHLPGHTADSSSLYDARDGVIYCGDMWEAPLPCVAWHHCDEYVRSLQTLLAMKPQVMLSSHSGLVTDEMVNTNLRYIEALAENREPEIEGIARAVHMTNRKLIFASRMEEEVRKNEHGFDLQAFTRHVIRSLDMPYDEFISSLNSFIQ